MKVPGTNPSYYDLEKVMSDDPPIHTTGFAQVDSEKRPARALGKWSDVWEGVELSQAQEWHAKPAAALEATIAEFKAALPGWWYSVCECQVSCDASCAPTTESPDVHLIALDPAFDSGFHADLRQPSSLAAALRDVMEQALAAKAALAERVPRGREALARDPG